MLEIPEAAVQALGLPWEEARVELQKDLVLALYSRGVLSAGKAAEMLGLLRNAFEQLLAERQIVRSYSMADLEHDLDWSKAQR